VAGFALRWALYRLGALAPRPARPALRAKARSSHDLMRRAWRILRT
jgi:hypothetical protein